MDFDHVLLALRIAFHLGTFWLVASYRVAPDTRYRAGVSALATLIAGSSVFLGIINLLTWPEQSMGWPVDIARTVLVGCVFSLAWMAGGNVARMLPRRIWS